MITLIGLGVFFFMNNKIDLAEKEDTVRVIALMDSTYKVFKSIEEKLGKNDIDSNYLKLKDRVNKLEIENSGIVNELKKRKKSFKK